MSVSKAKGRVCQEEKWLVAPPTVHISQCLIGRAALLLGMGPLSKDVWVRQRGWRLHRALPMVQQHLNGFFFNKTYTWILLHVNFNGLGYTRLHEQLLFVNTRTGGVCQIIPNQKKKTHGCIMQEPHIPPFPCSHVTEADGLKWSVNKLEHKAN